MAGLIKINWTPDRRELRNFGITLLVGLGVLGGLLGWKHHSTTPAYICTIIGAVIFVISISLPPIALVLYRIWMGIAFALGSVMSPVFLGLVYFGVFTPVGFLMRLFGRDSMQRRKTEGPTFWQKIEHRTEKSSYERQF